MIPFPFVTTKEKCSKTAEYLLCILGCLGSDPDGFNTSRANIKLVVFVLQPEQQNPLQTPSMYLLPLCIPAASAPAASFPALSQSLFWFTSQGGQAANTHRSMSTIQLSQRNCHQSVLPLQLWVPQDADINIKPQDLQHLPSNSPSLAMTSRMMKVSISMHYAFHIFFLPNLVITSATCLNE